MNLTLLRSILYLSSSFIILCNSYAFYMVQHYCNQPLKQGEYIMGAKTITSKEREVIVKRDGEQLGNKDTYVPGETLEITLQEGTYKMGTQHVFQISTGNAQFSNGGCEGKRSFKAKSQLVIPPDTTGPIKIYAGWAVAYEAVKMTPVFTLSPPKK